MPATQPEATRFRPLRKMQPLPLHLQRSVGIGGGLVCLLAGGLEWRIGPPTDSTLLYLPAVTVVAWYCGSRWAIALVGLASAFGAGFAIANGVPTSLLLWGVVSRSLLLGCLGLGLAQWNKARHRVRYLSRTDLLTGLANRRLLEEQIEAELSRTRRQPSAISLAFVDCDQFKQLNDQFGHPVGDDLLVRIADVLRENIRDYDTAARVGGDEFAILFPETSTDDATAAAERLHERLQQCSHTAHWDASFSIGVATFEEPPNNARELIAAADSLMYEVKRTSGNAIRHNSFPAKAPAGPDSAEFTSTAAGSAPGIAH